MRAPTNRSFAQQTNASGQAKQSGLCSELIIRAANSFVQPTAFVVHDGTETTTYVTISYVSVDRRLTLFKMVKQTTWKQAESRLPCESLSKNSGFEIGTQGAG